jgi:hypothetical protein
MNEKVIILKNGDFEVSYEDKIIVKKDIVIKVPTLNTKNGLKNEKDN